MSANVLPPGVIYLSELPARVPIGKVLVHNHIRPARQLGDRGFRAWLSNPDPLTLEVCPCAWARKLGLHYRVRIARGVQ
jgi:hypothetical protein